jgi:uncharacterized membrane-anchored protein
MPYAVAAAMLILLSGAFMVWAGYQFACGHIATGLLLTTPPGFTIEAAFLFVRRVERINGRSGPSWKIRICQEAVILLAGGVMVLAGFAGNEWNWYIASLLILLGLPIMGLVVWLGRRTASINP